MAITRRITLDAPAERVWAALSDPALLSEWLDAEVDLEVRPDAEGSITENGVVRRVRVERVLEHALVEWEWAPEDAPDDRSTVTLTLEETEDGCVVEVTERRAAAAATCRHADATIDDRWGGRLLGLELRFLRAPALT